MDAAVGRDDARDLADAQAERRVLEGLLHLPAGEEAEVASRRVRRTVGVDLSWTLRGQSVRHRLVGVTRARAEEGREGAGGTTISGRRGKVQPAGHIPSLGNCERSCLMVCS